jgi:hypothetical protein
MDDGGGGGGVIILGLAAASAKYADRSNQVTRMEGVWYYLLVQSVS